jgi:hypothetical protein
VVLAVRPGANSFVYDHRSVVGSAKVKEFVRMRANNAFERTLKVRALSNKRCVAADRER